MYPGGNCLNVAVNVRRFGAQSAYIGAIGKDPAGDLIYDALPAERVDIRRLRRLDDATAYCLIGHREAERVFLDFDLGVSMFTPTPEDFEFLSGFDAVHIGQSSGLDAYVDAASRRPCYPTISRHGGSPTTKGDRPPLLPGISFGR